jgi:hypothetical protein
MRVVTVVQSGTGAVQGRRTQVVVSRTGPQGASGGGAGTIALDDLTDVALVGTTSGDLLRYNGTAWTDTKLVASDLGTGTADAFHFLAGDLTWQDAVPLDVGAKNTTASTIAKGTPVYVTGSVGAGATVEVAPAQASSSGTMTAIGLTTSELAAGVTGYVRVMGVLSGVSTGAYSINQTLYVGSAGGLTSTRPTGSTTLVQNIGKVIRSNNNNGEILVMGPGRANDVPNLIGTGFLASSGTASASTYLRGDQSWSAIAASDVGAVPTSRNVSTSTGLTGGGDLSADRTLSVLYGTTSGTAAAGNDARLSDARTPTAHKTSHESGGSDELALAANQITSGTVATARLGSGTASANTFLRGDQTYQPVPVGNNDMGRVSNAIYLTGSGLSLNGATSGNTATTPDAAALDVTGDIEMVVRAVATDWSSAAAQALVSKRQTTTTQSYRLMVLNGLLYLLTSTNGSDFAQTSSSVVVPFSAGQAGWIRVTRNATTGDVFFYTAADSSSEPSSWTQLGTSQSTTPSTIYNSNSQLEIGSNLNGGNPFVGTIYRAIVRNGIAGTTVFDANFATAAADALAFTSGPGSGAYLDGSTGLVVQGVAGNFASSPDLAAYTPTNLELVARFSTDSVASGAKTITNKRTAAAELEFDLSADGTSLRLRRSYNGSTWGANVTSSAFLSAGTAVWVKVTHNPTTGATEFYSAADQSTEPSSWTARGTATSTTGTPYNGTGTLNVGSPASSELLSGTVRQVILRSDIGGTVVYNANFAAQTANATTFQEANGATVTVTNPYVAPVTITTTRYAYGLPNVQFTGTGTQALTANTVYYQPFEVTAPITLDFMALEVTGAAAGNGNLRLGIYAADTNLQPTGAPLFDSGDVTVTSGATGILSKQGTAVTLQPGVYLTATNTSVGFTARTFLGGVSFVPTTIGANVTVLTSVAQTQGAFPTPGTAWTTRASANGPARHTALLRWR